MSNNEIFMTTIIIHSFQGFHIHYGMYVVVMRLEILLLFFFFFLLFPDTLMRLKGGNLREKISAIKNKVS
jgi:hypothetical protein